MPLQPVRGRGRAAASTSQWTIFCMTTHDRHPRRGIGHETPGSVDYPFDADPQNVGARGLASDAACTIPWQIDGFEAIQVFVDPVLRDRSRQLCDVVTAWAGAHGDLDGLSAAAMQFSEREDVSAAIHENPRDELSTGVVAIAFTLG